MNEIEMAMILAHTQYSGTSIVEGAIVILEEIYNSTGAKNG